MQWIWSGNAGTTPLRTIIQQYLTSSPLSLQSTKISVDAPRHFLRPHRESAKVGINQTKSRESFCRTLTKGSKFQSPYESSYVLPGGASMLEATMKSKETFTKSSYRLFIDGNRVSIMTEK